MTYATIEDIENRIGRTLTEQESTICNSLLERAAKVIDAYNANADLDNKNEVSINTVQRVIVTSTDMFPVGASQGSMGALGYNQSFTISGGGGVGQIYLDKYDKKLLGVGNLIGSYSPVEELVSDSGN